LLHLRGNDQDAETLYRQALASDEAAFGKNNFQVANARAGLGEVLIARGQFDEAQTQLIEADRVYAGAETVQPGKHDQCIRTLVHLFTERDRAEPGKGYDAQAATWQARLQSTSGPTTAATSPT